MTARNTVPKSRIMLTYDTRQPDQPRKEKELPLRLLVVGDLSGRSLDKPQPEPGAPPPPKDDFEDRKIHDLNGANLDTVMAKLKIGVWLSGVTNHVDKAGTPFSVTVPIKSMASFEPGEVVYHIPVAKRLLDIRKNLLELQACVDNNKQFRGLVRKLTSPANAALLEQLRTTFTGSKDLVAKLRIPTKAELSDAPAPPPAAAITTPAGKPPTPTAPPTTPTPTPTPAAPTT